MNVSKFHEVVQCFINCIKEEKLKNNFLSFIEIHKLNDLLKEKPDAGETTLKHSTYRYIHYMNELEIMYRDNEYNVYYDSEIHIYLFNNNLRKYILENLTPEEQIIKNIIK